MRLDCENDFNQLIEKGVSVAETAIYSYSKLNENFFVGQPYTDELHSNLLKDDLFLNYSKMKTISCFNLILADYKYKYLDPIVKRRRISRTCIPKI
jgi:hypothetical protein